MKTDIDLNPLGFARAASLPRLFPAPFDTPNFIFAAHAGKHSNRPVETVMPLAKSLGLKIDSRFGEREERALARKLLSTPAYAEKIVLVCWHHEGIPSMAKALGVADAPPKWPDKQFDRIWKIRFDAGAPGLADLPQHLMPGDAVR